MNKFKRFKNALIDLNAIGGASESSRIIYKNKKRIDQTTVLIRFLGGGLLTVVTTIDEFEDWLEKQNG